MIDEEEDLDKSFNETPEGKKLLKKYQEQIEKMESSDADDWDNEAFIEAEHNYLRAQGEYTAKKIVDAHGEEYARKYASNGRLSEAEDFVKAMGDEYVYIHAY